MINAIRRAIEYCRTHDTLTATTKAKDEKSKKEEQQQATDAMDAAGLESRLKKAVVATFDSTRAAFDTHSKHGIVGKKEWKKLLKKTMPSLKQESLKLLRRRLPNRMSWIDFSAFFGGSGESGESNSDKGKAVSNEGKAEAASSGMAALPPEVPECECLICCTQ